MILFCQSFIKMFTSYQTCCKNNIGREDRVRRFYVKTTKNTDKFGEAHHITNIKTLICATWHYCSTSLLFNNGLLLVLVSLRGELTDIYETKLGFCHLEVSKKSLFVLVFLTSSSSFSIPLHSFSGFINFPFLIIPPPISLYTTIFKLFNVC